MAVSPAPRSRSANLLVLGILAAGLVFAAYSNHFRNAFHFDDGTVIQNNAYLRSLHNIPLFFRDATTFSSYPPNATYRPLTSTSFALDYWMGGGPDPFRFHVTQWTLHLLLAILAYFFLERVLSLAGLEDRARFLALFGAALFGVHRGNSETVNFLTLRSEILAALGVVGSFVMYQRLPRTRRSFVWLLPALAGAFAKQSAIVFAPLLAAYLLVFPEERVISVGPKGARKRWPWLAPVAPAFIVAGAFYVLQGRLGGPGMVWGSTPRLTYLQTQTFAWLHYLRLFLLPLGLSADSDLTAIPHWYDTRVVAGVLFAAAFVAAAILYARRRKAGRAFLFGMIWFFVTLAPTSSLFPLSEMVNEHRPYLPYIGLVLCLMAAVGDLLANLDPSGTKRKVLVAGGLVLLLAHAWGTFERNKAWLTDETLWKSVTEASPNNGRAWMNYGLIFMSRADYAAARFCFERAATFAPNYDVLEINLAILEGATGNKPEAERHFRRALALNSATATVHFYFGRWLFENGRDAEAAAELSTAVSINPADLDARRLLLSVYERQRNAPGACAVATATLALVPGDPVSSKAAQQYCGAR
jgi:tetratricopeptide (TPR) repeat protein